MEQGALDGVEMDVYIYMLLVWRLCFEWHVWDVRACWPVCTIG